MRSRGQWGSALVVGLLVLCGVGVLLHVAYMDVKAAVARHLIKRAASDTLHDGRPRRPWSWADMVVLGRLTLPGRGIERDILSGATMQTLAFGVGHVDGSSSLAGQGNCVLAGHRDGVFTFLGEMVPGEVVVTETSNGERRWVVEELYVVSSDDLLPLEPSDEARLTLVTCYPVDGLWSSEERLVVRCGEAGGGQSDLVLSRTKSQE